jgi:RNA polymerase sigma factor (sigma-70 family)
VTDHGRYGASALVGAFEHLVRAHRAEIYRTNLRRSRNREDVDDLTQATFLDAYMALRRGDRPVAPRAWLHAIARNRAARRFRRPTLLEVELELDRPAEVDESLPTLGELKPALARLTEKQRSALLLREVGGLSADEIAAALGLSRGAVETLLFRARRSLRAEFGVVETKRKKRSPVAGLAYLIGSAGRRAALVGMTAAAGGVATVGTHAFSASAHHSTAVPASIRVVAPAPAARLVATRTPHLVSHPVAVRSPRAPRRVSKSDTPVRMPVSAPTAPTPASATAAPAPVSVSAPVHAARARPITPPPTPVRSAPAEPVSPASSSQASRDPESPAPAVASTATSTDATRTNGTAPDNAQQVVHSVGAEVDSAAQEVTSAATPVVASATAPVQDVAPSATPVVAAAAAPVQAVTSAAAPVTSALPPPSVTVPNATTPSLPAPPVLPPLPVSQPPDPQLP